MKMVSAAKLRRAQEMAVAARPYAERMERMLSSLAAGTTSSAGGPPLLSGTGKDDVHLLVVITSDRGLCGSFNVNIMRGVRQRVRALEAEGKTVKIYGVGRKGIMLARREYRSKVVEALEDASKPVPSFEKAAEIAADIARRYEDR